MNLQFPGQLAVTIVLFVLSVAFAPGSYAQSSTGSAQSSPAGIDYPALRQRVEQIETKDAHKLGLDDLKPVIETAKTDLQAYINANQKNVDAMILYVRLGFIEEIFINSREKTTEQAVDPEDLFAPLHQRLDRVLEIDPDNAEAHYWKARLYGIKTRVTDNQGNTDMQPVDLEQAIDFAAKAVKLDKDNLWYREVLAVYHITAGDRKSALEVLEPVTTYNPVNILLKDLDAFPLPEGTVLLQKDARNYSELQLEQKTIKDFPQLRAQVFAVPMTASQLEEFFQKDWPQFSFFRQGPVFYAQFLVFDPDLRPSRNIAEARFWAQSEQGGIILSVMEVKNPTAAEKEKSPQGQLLPASFGDSFSYVYYVNKRNLE